MATIRLAREQDVRGIFAVRLAVRENALSLAELADLGITPETVAAMIVDDVCAWVAEEAGAIIGFSMVDAAEACLFATFVLPEAEGRGIGRALVVRAEAALFARHEAIWLETAAGSRAAGFWAALGWREVAPGDEPGDLRFEKARAG